MISRALSALSDESYDDPTGERFGVVITSRARHGDLWAAAQKLGGIKALARYLGSNITSVYKWVNLRHSPTRDHPRREELAEKLLILTGKSWDELWPEPLRQAIKGGEIGKKMATHHSVRMEELAIMAKDRLILADPRDEIADAETVKLVKEKIGLILKTLTRREAEIVKMRFGIDRDRTHTLEECAEVFQICRERARYIEAKAIHKLQHKVRVEKLTGAAGELWSDFLGKGSS